MIDSLSGLQPSDDLVFFGYPLRRNDERNMFANGFFRGITEDSLRALVPTLDDAVQRFANDRIVGRLDNGGQQPRGAQPLGCFLLESPALANVSENEHAADEV